MEPLLVLVVLLRGLSPLIAKLLVILLVLSVQRNDAFHPYPYTK